jgi:hypothetical protein
MDISLFAGIELTVVKVLERKHGDCIQFIFHQLKEKLIGYEILYNKAS